jgi:hypothetical protein
VKSYADTNDIAGSVVRFKRCAGWWDPRMYFLVKREQHRPRSTQLWANTYVAARLERLGKRALSGEYETAIAGNRFQRMAVFQLARPAVQ